MGSDLGFNKVPLAAECRTESGESRVQGDQPGGGSVVRASANGTGQGEGVVGVWVWGDSGSVSKVEATGFLSGWL